MEARTAYKHVLHVRPFASPEPDPSQLRPTVELTWLRVCGEEPANWRAGKTNPMNNFPKASAKTYKMRF